MFESFKSFVARGNVIDLAVGMMIGTAFGKIVNSLVNDILMPPLGILLGKVNFNNLYINLTGHHYQSLKQAEAAGAATINYGLFINAIVDFFIIAILLFIAIRQLEHMRSRKVPEVQPMQTCPFCLSNIPLGAVRCPNCTSHLSNLNHSQTSAFHRSRNGSS